MYSKIGLFFIYILAFANVFFTCENKKTSDVNVIVFLNNECPICQKASLSLRQLEEYSNDINIKNIQIQYVFNANISEKEITNFLDKYQLNNHNFIIDNNNINSKKYKATITPEAFILKNKKILYQGKIDDMYFALGVKKQGAITNYLLENIQSLNDNNTLKYESNDAVGCFIE